MVVAIHRRTGRPMQAPMQVPKKPRNMFGNGQSIFGGMPEYIANMDPAAAQPEGLMSQGQAPKSSPIEGLMSQGFEKPSMTMSDKLGMLGAYLKDYDGTWGDGNVAEARGLYDERVNESQAEFDRQRQEQILMAAAQGDETALAYLDPLANRSFQYGAKRDQVGDARYEDETGYARGRDAVSDQRYGQEWERGIYESDRGYGLEVDKFGEGKRQFGLNYGLDARRVSAAEAATAQEAASGANREMRQDSSGKWRYVDDKSPVFPDDKAAAKPLIGAESMGRVAAGLPNMRQAVEDLKGALGVSIDDNTATTVEGGYRPGQDWGAMAWDQVPIVGDIFARGAGGEDYQKFDNAYSTFEAAALPIMSGAAVTDSEAKRALKALRVRIGDTDEAVARKMANMNRMVAGLEAAARGDTAALQAIVGDVNSGGSDSTATGTTRDDLIRKYLD